MLPADLPRVAVTGVPTRLRVGETPAEQRAYWEWLWVELADGGALAVFDPDHLCTPGWFGRPCRLGIEFFHPVVRTSIYDGIDPLARSEGHRRAAEILLAAGALPEQAAAHLLLTTGEDDEFVIATL